VVPIWNGQVAAPKDCGVRGDDPTRRKIRPIALEEALLRFAETVACDAEIDQALATLEPHQLGAGTPDGTVLLVNVLRMWLSADEQPALADDGVGSPAADVLDAPLYFSSDLRNAYGLVKRSALLRGTRLKAPRLARMLAAKWCDGTNTVYHRIRQSGSRVHTWEESTAERGGGQGSRLMMLAFCCSLASTLEAARRAAEQGLPDAAAAAARTRFVGYQDDQYFRSSIREFLLYEPVLLAALEADGHELQPSKSKVWIPALDAVEVSDAPVQAQELWGRYGRARHGLVALGSSAQGQAETQLGRDGTVALEPVAARAAKGSSRRASRARYGGTATPPAGYARRVDIAAQLSSTCL